MPETIHARLVGGAHDGHTDLILAPAAPLVCLHYCGQCRRVHLHEIAENDARPLGDEEVGPVVYALDVDATTVVCAIYRPFDLDQELAAILPDVARARVPALTPAGKRNVGAVFAGVAWPPR